MRIFHFLKATKLSSVLALLFFLLVCGGFLRMDNLAEQSYWMDEGYTVNAIIAIQEKGAPVLDSGQYYFCPTYCYPTAIAISLLGESPASYRLVAAVAGTIFIILIFFVARQLFSLPVALVTSFLVTFSYWQIAWSRQARGYTLFAVFFWSALFFFNQGLKSHQYRLRYFSGAAFFTILAILTHGLGYLLPLIFASWVLIDRYLNKKSLSVQFLLPSFLVFLFIALAMERQLGTFSQLALHYELPYYLNFYLRTYWFLILLGLFGFFSQYSLYRREYLFLGSTILIYLLPLSFLTDIVHYRYLFHITPVFFIAAAVGIYSLYKNRPRSVPVIISGLALCLLYATVDGGVFVPRTNYYLESDDPATLSERPHYAYTPQPNWKAAYTFIAENRQPGDIIISSHAHLSKIYLKEAGYWLAYDYLGLQADQADSLASGKERYVDAEVIGSVATLQKVTSAVHGFLVIDFMAAEKIDSLTLDYITANFTLVFSEKTSTLNQVWVYRF
jgi:Dolichyl-phosphate-mannose-protein mannosyltransferase